MTIILDKADLHNAINEYIRSHFGTSLVLTSYKVGNLKGKGQGEYRVTAEVDNNGSKETEQTKDEA